MINLYTLSFMQWNFPQGGSYLIIILYELVCVLLNILDTLIILISGFALHIVVQSLQYKQSKAITGWWVHTSHIGLSLSIVSQKYAGIQIHPTSSQSTTKLTWSTQVWVKIKKYILFTIMRRHTAARVCLLLHRLLLCHFLYKCHPTFQGLLVKSFR